MRTFLISLLCLLNTSCVRIHDETLYIAGDLITVQVNDNKPKVRVATGVDECRWRAKVDIPEKEWELWFLCERPFRF